MDSLKVSFPARLQNETPIQAAACNIQDALFLLESIGHLCFFPQAGLNREIIQRAESARAAFIELAKHIN